MDKLLDKVKFDKRYVFFSMVIVILGIVTGALFIVILNNTDKNLVIEYITSYVESIINNTSNINTLPTILFMNIIIIFIMTIVGFTYILFPINIVILFYKAFVIGFSLSAFSLTYKFKGLIISIIYIFPHLIINILVFSLLTAFTVKLSVNMIKNIINKKSVDMRSYISKYMVTISIFIVIVILTSLYETYIIPYLIKIVFNLLK